MPQPHRRVPARRGKSALPPRRTGTSPVICQAMQPVTSANTPIFRERRVRGETRAHLRDRLGAVNAVAADGSRCHPRASQRQRVAVLAEHGADDGAARGHDDALQDVGFTFDADALFPDVARHEPFAVEHRDAVRAEALHEQVRVVGVAGRHRPGAVRVVTDADHGLRDEEQAPVIAHAGVRTCTRYQGAGRVGERCGSLAISGLPLAVREAGDRPVVRRATGSAVLA